MKREPEAWQTGAAGPFLTVGAASVWSLGRDRFRVESLSGDEPVEDFDEARRRAHELADVA
jgi:hypothetical protein